MEEKMYVEEMGDGPSMMTDMAKTYTPKRQEILRDYEISIRFLSVGCIIKVGCKEIPFTSVNEAMDKLSLYVKDPYEEGKKWQKVFDEQG